ncbi:hypothetical protein ACET3Z_026953 [Daucus carota]
MHISNSLNSTVAGGAFIALLLVQCLLVQSQYFASPENHFINCGSNNDTTLNSRKFIADSSSDGAVSTSTATIPPLYQTAKVFTSLSRYKLTLVNNGTYVVRLHFYPFSSPARNLLDANFSVSASGYTLLSDFRVHKSDKLPVIEEFIFFIDSGTFEIIFAPEKSSFAFVNAIETFLAPENFIPGSAPHVTTSGSDEDDYNDLLTQILRPVYRINVGGELLSPDNDTLWRNWITDDNFLYHKEVAKNIRSYGSKPNYPLGGATKYSAPDPVYQTAKEMKIDPQKTSNFFNITWQFNVTRNVKHFMRVHFCDILSDSENSDKFNFYIFSKFSSEIKDKNSEVRTPFYNDFVVDSDTFGWINISIGPREENQTAFLNGLEIMELVNDESRDSSGENKISKKFLIIIIIGSVVGVVALALVLLVIFVIRRRRKAKAVEKSDWPLVNLYGGNSYSGLTESAVKNESNFQTLNLELKLAFSEIMYATNKFDPKSIIGKGGFGKVYKGTLRNGIKVAVKRSESGHGQGLPEFQTEIMVLSSIRHRHLVSLIGYCDEMSEMILVYEFMEKGTLQDHLYKGTDPKSRAMPVLSWNQRLDICIGAAKGLNYLHTEGSGGGIIHRDVKSTNILLDKDFVAKVSDFGLSRSGLPEQTHISTGVKGSFGYLDPEYFRCMQLTQKSDVYSFGVVLLEVLSARPAINNLLPREQVNLADWGVYLQQKGELEKIVDPLLVGKINPNSLRKFGETAAKCLREEGADRPSMVDVIWDLEYALQLQCKPHEESITTDVSWAMPLPVVQRLPSTSLTINEDEMHLRIDDVLDSSYADASEVFSQLKIDDAR